jgi:hypothetical protein
LVVFISVFSIFSFASAAFIALFPSRTFYAFSIADRTNIVCWLAEHIGFANGNAWQNEGLPEPIRQVRVAHCCI